MTYLLDTNVVSEIRKRQPDPNLLAWWATVAADELFISALTIGELRKGAELLRRKDPIQAGSLDRWLYGVLTSYRDRIAVVDTAVAQEWGRMNVPDPMPIIDGLLGATARVRGWILVTRNTTDLSGHGVRLLDPFRSVSGSNT